MSTEASTRTPKRSSPRRGGPDRAPAAPAFDYPLIAILATLLALGLVSVQSASLGMGMDSGFFLKQLTMVVAGIMVMLVMARIPYRFWQRVAVPILVLALGLLVAVLFFASEPFGAKRTLLVLQPSEFSKLAVIIYISAWVSAKGKQVSRVQDGLLPFVILMSAVTVLLVLEPSFSVAIIILLIGVTIFFVGGADVKQLLVMGGLGIGVLLLLILQYKHASERIENWLNPSTAPYDPTVVWQNGLFGSGPFMERIVQRSPVPLPYSDYLFAHIGHLVGILGALLVVVLFAALGYRCLGVALNAPEKFGALVAIGITTWILVQAAIHMGTSLSLIPQTGQPLPFMSAGGSAMISCMAAMGIMMSIWRASPEKKALHASAIVRGGNWGARLPDAVRRQRAEIADSSQKNRKPSIKRRTGFATSIRRVFKARGRPPTTRVGPKKPSETDRKRPAQRTTKVQTGDRTRKR
jgi:cell division protein FtsW